ncbi:MAG TPA: type II toxin-antitoxin system CcdA family antitoxin [Solirubrobacterales bacterium]|nr:type II toxin-antitoxin system CcdA family antitoxin [Solirubrobacterales bacterium]
MASVNVYLPDDLADEVRRAELNVSRITQEAVRAELAAAGATRWLRQVSSLPPTEAGHDQALAAVEDARAELGA